MQTFFLSGSRTPQCLSKSHSLSEDTQTASQLHHHTGMENQNMAPFPYSHTVPSIMPTHLVNTDIKTLYAFSPECVLQDGIPATSVVDHLDTCLHLCCQKYQHIDTQIPIMYNSYGLYFQLYLYTCSSYTSLLSAHSEGRLTPHTHTILYRQCWVNSSRWC